jgi:hypothetical protein
MLKFKKLFRYTQKHLKAFEHNKQTILPNQKSKHKITCFVKKNVSKNDVKFIPKELSSDPKCGHQE